MGTSSPDLFLSFDRSRPRGLRVQIEEGLRDAIRSGRLSPGAVVPSTRTLAADLAVTRRVVVEAYDQLIAEGYLLARPGAGTVVNHAPRTPPAAHASPTTGAPDVEIDFRPGRPDLDLFPRTAWARATRTALQRLPNSDLAYDDPRGLPALRGALADYLGRVRGVNADPEQIVVCAAFAHGFDLLLTVLRARGYDRFAVENPGYANPRLQLASRGIRYEGVRVDADGLVVDDLRRTAARIVHVTPAHQSPTGVVLSADRRHELVDWAREVEGYIIEDDYDAEYRYDRRPVGALQGIAADRVIYCGTTSKCLSSGVRIGWLVVPPELVEPIIALRHLTDGATSTILQATFAEFLACGDFDRHLRRTRRIYRQRRDTIVAALQHSLPNLTPSGVAAGLNILLTLPTGTDEHTTVQRALAAGVRVYPLTAFRTNPTAHDTPGLVIGYGAVPPTIAERGIRLLAQGIANLPR